MNELPPLAIGAITAALITGLVSFLGLIISKEQKVSEFRQAWIDSLRSELAALISHANAIHGAGMAKLGSSSETWKVEELEVALAPDRPMDYSEINRVEQELVAAAQVLLKNEWLRVRRGERAYRLAKAAATLVVFGGLFILAAVVVLKTVCQWASAAA